MQVAVSNGIVLNVDIVGEKTECSRFDYEYIFGFSKIWQFTYTVLLKVFKVVPYKLFKLFSREGERV